MKIGIIGGGTAGLIAALILKNRFENFTIDIIKSEKIGIIGVGEGSTEHWKEFCDFANISIEELIRETDATFKYGVMFEGWTEKPYLHNVAGGLSRIKFGQYLSGYAYSIIKKIESKKYASSFCWKNKIAVETLANQFHFNTLKLNNFLIKKCKEKGIKFFEDEIKEVVTTDKIELLKGNQNYKYDFYIDCTGFKRLLISKLGSKWVSYKDYLPMNEAIAFPTDDTEEYTPYTLAKAMSAGWMWRIPTNGRWGNGYVYDNRYIDADQAKEECEKFLNQKITINKNIKFDAGSVDKAWIKNCVAIGLSSSFIEPLEASSIGTSIQQTFILMHLISNYQSRDIELYNKKYTQIVENIRDFVLLHYMCSKKDSKFWKELKLKIPKSLEDILEISKNRLLINEDFEHKYLLFKEQNFTIILKELNLINVDQIKKEYNNLSENLKNLTKENISGFLNQKYFEISHKKFLNSLRGQTGSIKGRLGHHK